MRLKSRFTYSLLSAIAASCVFQSKNAKADSKIDQICQWMKTYGAQEESDHQTVLLLRNQGHDRTQGVCTSRIKLIGNCSQIGSKTRSIFVSYFNDALSTSSTDQFELTLKEDDQMYFDSSAREHSEMTYFNRQSDRLKFNFDFFFTLKTPVTGWEILSQPSDPTLKIRFKAVGSFGSRIIGRLSDSRPWAHAEAEFESIITLSANPESALELKTNITALSESQDITKSNTEWFLNTSSLNGFTFLNADNPALCK